MKRILAALCLMHFVANYAVAADEPAPKPNVVLIFIDDLG